MANIRIKDFPRSTTIADADVLATDGDNGTKSVTWGQAKELIKEQCGINDLNTEIDKTYQSLLYTTDLTGSGMIPNFDNYTEFVIMVSASGFITSHYVPKSVLQSGMIFHSSYYYSANSNAMASIWLNPNGIYQIAKGLSQNSQGSSVMVYGR